MRRDRLPIVLVVTALAMVGLPALASAGPRVTRSSSSSGFEFGLIGGPHATGEGRAGLPQLVRDVAAAEVGFMIHHGGIGRPRPLPRRPVPRDP